MQEVVGSIPIGSTKTEGHPKVAFLLSAIDGQHHPPPIADS